MASVGGTALPVSGSSVPPLFKKSEHNRSSNVSLLLWDDDPTELRLTRKPEDFMLDLYHVKLQSQSLHTVLYKIRQAVYRLSLQVLRLQHSPIKGRCKSLDGRITFVISVWYEDKEDGTIIVSLQQARGDDSVLFCNYAMAILNSVQPSEKQVVDEFRPHHEYELPDMTSPELREDKGRADADEEAKNLLQHVRVLIARKNEPEQDDFYFYDDSSSWLTELLLWTDPRKTDPMIALATGLMLLSSGGDDNNYNDVRDMLLDTAFSSTKKRKRNLKGGYGSDDLGDDTIVALMILALVLEMVVAHDPPTTEAREDVLLSDFAHHLKKKGHLAACVTNAKQASLHPHEAYASVKLLCAVATRGVEFTESLREQDAIGAVEKALEFGSTRHAALEAECKILLTKLEDTSEGPDQPILAEAIPVEEDDLRLMKEALRLKEEALQLREEALRLKEDLHEKEKALNDREEALVRREEALKHKEEALMGREAAETRHDTLQDEINMLKTVEECAALYDSARFQECIRTLRKAQDDAIRANPNISPVVAKEEWARLVWAPALSEDKDWAWSLNHMRRAALRLLYKVCNLCWDETTKTFREDLERVFQRKRLNQILFHCVVMDRANCLYNMMIEATHERGLGWYSKGEEERYKALGDPPLPLNPGGNTMNKRLRRLQQNLYADNSAMARLLTIEAPPRLGGQIEEEY